MRPKPARTSRYPTSAEIDALAIAKPVVELCRGLGLLGEASVAIDGSKFKAVNNRDRNFTRGKMERRLAQIEESVARYLHQLDSADRQEPSPALTNKTTRRRATLNRLAALDAQLPQHQDQPASLPHTPPRTN